MCVSLCMYRQTHGPRCEYGDQRVTGVGSSHHVSPKDQSHVIMLDGKHPHLLATPILTFNYFL